MMLGALQPHVKEEDLCSRESRRRGGFDQAACWRSRLPESCLSASLFGLCPRSDPGPLSLRFSHSVPTRTRLPIDLHQEAFCLHPKAYLRTEESFHFTRGGIAMYSSRIRTVLMLLALVCLVGAPVVHAATSGSIEIEEGGGAKSGPRSLALRFPGRGTTPVHLSIFPVPALEAALPRLQRKAPWGGGTPRVLCREPEDRQRNRVAGNEEKQQGLWGHHEGATEDAQVRSQR